MIAVDFRNVSKAFPGVQALNNVTFSIDSGSCHALMGENGAGKSTLGKLLAGLYQADSGSVEVFGKPANFRSPFDAQRAGVAIVHQELLFCENLSVADNLSLDDLPRRGWFLDDNELQKRASEALALVGSEVDPNTVVSSLPVGVQQMVQIAAALRKQSKIIVFDEPTSSLSQVEAETLFDQIEQLKARGITCVYVSHRMDDIYRLCDTVTVMRDGLHVATTPISQVSRNELVVQMIGREVHQIERGEAKIGSPTLTVRGLTSPGKLRSVSLDVAGGEVVGLAGLVGSGRTEIAEAIFGLDAAAKGEIRLSGKAVKGTPRDRMEQGTGFATEDRKRTGLVTSMTVKENASLTILDRLSQFGWLQSRAEQELVGNLKQQLQIKTPTLDTNILGLSGGNQQKVVLAKWLATDCQLLILDEPTRGVDVGAKTEIQREIRNLASQGKALLVISSELPELLAVCDRILVVREGSVVGEFSAVDVNEKLLLESMAGLTDTSR